MSSLPSPLLWMIAAAFGLLVLLWLAGRDTAPPPIAIATATATQPVSSPTPTLAPPSAPPGYRLAGVAMGGDTSYAAIESPGGSTGLYRLQADVPGLGKLVRIEGERVIVRVAAGEFEMWVAPAPTPSFTPTRRRTPRLTPTRAATYPPADV